ncbi:MAG: hypothetical protein HY816_06950 [Candidatus Wallbacteria bacterium]|nr:hypothetical protein [Candidatus Wallbacteria bacterium]
MQTNEPATCVLGQPGFAQGTANTGGIGASTLQGPEGISSSGGRLFLTDGANRRVLIWNAIPTTIQKDADIVLGQPGFTSNAANSGGLRAGSLAYAQGLCTDGTRVFVADSQNHRVLIWNSLPSTSQQPADLVLGQPDFTSNTPNNGGISASSLSNPESVFSDGTRLFVTDGNNRVLIWNSIPTESMQPADLVLGQPDFASSTPNNGGVSAVSLNHPQGIASDGVRLYISDSDNNRVLVWNKLPTQHRQPADLVLGQPDLTSASVNNAGIGAGTLFSPEGVCSDGTRLFVADCNNHRVLVWNVLPAQHGRSADLVLGQPDFASNTANNGGISASTMRNPVGVAVAGGRLFVGDYSNNRVLAFVVQPPHISQASPSLLVNDAPVEITLTGNGFAGVTALRFDDALQTQMTQLLVIDDATLRATVPAGIAPGSYGLIVTRDGSQVAATGATVRIRAPAASLVVTGAALPANVSAGQAFSAAADLRNTGGTSADITSCELAFAPSGLSAVRTDSVTSIGASATATLRFDVAVAGSALPGTRTARLDVQANDADTGEDVSLLASELPGPLSVQTSATLLIDAVELPSARVWRGRTGLTVRTRVSNPGNAGHGAALRNLSLRLAFSAGAEGFSVTPATGNVTTLAAGAGAWLTFTVDLLATAPAGPTTLSAVVLAAVDANSGRAASVDNEAWASWSVVAANANAGSDGRVSGLGRVTLDGRDSTIAGNLARPTYTWDFVQRPEGSSLRSSDISPNATTGAQVVAFTPDRYGTYVLSLVLTADGDSSAADTVAVEVVSTPVARIAGGPRRRQRAGTGGTIRIALDGRSSFDPAFGPLVYHWRLLDSPAGTSDLSFSHNDSPAAAETSLDAIVPGTYAVQLRVETASSESEPVTAEVEAIAGKQAFILDPLPGQTIRRSNVAASFGAKRLYRVRFAGFDEADAGAWSVAAAGSSAGGIGDGDGTGSATIEIEPGIQTITLRKLGQEVDAVQVDVAATAAPFVEILTKPSSGGPRRIHLDPGDSHVGAGSSGSPLFQWTLDGAPRGATTFQSTVTKPNYVLTAIGRYTFTLTVTDSSNSLASTSQVAVAVVDVPPSAPVFLDRTIYLKRPDSLAPHPEATSTFALDAAGSADRNGQALTYRWDVVEAPDRSVAHAATTTLVSIQAASEARTLAVFSPASRLADSTPVMAAAGQYRFRLSVSDGTNVTTSTIAVVALDPASLLPTADAEIDRIVYAGVSVPGGPITSLATDDPLERTAKVGFVRLDGRNSADPKRRSLTYRWTVATRPPGSTLAELQDADTPLAWFVPDKLGVYVLRLVVNNGIFGSAPAVVRIDVRGVNPETGEPWWDTRAQLELQDLTNAVRTSASVPVLETLTGHRVLLDAISSRTTKGLSFRFGQLGGPTVDLEKGGIESRETFTPVEPGTYLFSVKLVTGAGSIVSSAAAQVRVRSASPPAVSVVSSASTTEETGHEMRSETPTMPTGSLRVTLPTTVTLTALVGQADRGRIFDFAWRQLDGPPALLSRLTERRAGSEGSVTQFTPTTSRLHLFEVSATPLATATLLPDGPPAVRKIRVIVSQPDAPIPQPVPKVERLSLISGLGKLARKLRGAKRNSDPNLPVQLFGTPASTVEVDVVETGCNPSYIKLDGSGSRYLTNRPLNERLRYRWVEVTFNDNVSMSRPNDLVTEAYCFRCGPKKQHLIFNFYIDVLKPGDRSESVSTGLELEGTDPSTMPPEVGGVRLFLDGSLPVSEVLTSPALLAEFHSLALPSFVLDGQELVLLATDSAGTPVRPAITLRRNRLKFAADGPTKFESLEDGELVVSDMSRGSVTRAWFVPTTQQLAAFSGGMASITPLSAAVLLGGGSGRSGGCWTNPKTPWRATSSVILLLPGLYALLLRFCSRGQRRSRPPDRAR